MRIFADGFEKELGVRLFERTSRRVALTDAGEAFVAARAIHFAAAMLVFGELVFVSFVAVTARR